MSKDQSRSAFRIVLYYLLFGIGWIAVSDRLLEQLVQDPHRLSTLQTYKGWAFVLASALLVYLTMQRELHAGLKTDQALRESEEKYHSLIETANDAVFIIDADTGIILDTNKRACTLLGLPREAIIGMHQQEIHPAEQADKCRKILEALINKSGVITGDLCVFHREGRTIPVEVSGTIAERGGKRFIQLFFRDISLRKAAEDLAQKRLQRLAALHAIDMIISSSLDLRITLSEVLDLVISQLHVDAADVLLLNTDTQTLTYAAGRGFRTATIEQSSLRMGEGIAGIAALEHRSIIATDLRDPANDFQRAALLESEGFLAYAVVPLMAKGKVLGVLEVLQRDSWDVDAEWQSYLESLAAQAAIAIDNAALFDELQQSAIEVTLAYDATLAGWARALDLRSRETERHTERVAEMALRLARAVGMGAKEMVNVRRGALLHDIGKIGISDNILLKPGPLTEEEWTIMRRHPQFAFDMLQPIAYLRPALDIPYCHHEWWDGTGYPRNLKGEQIPLAARIFAVADVWDALIAKDRPYRQGISKEEIREHIRSLSGTQLDPRVVDTFLGMEW
jgi:PAS domain S-box-containing protein/putative nucleotidyltransferase with HDIG domain